MQSEHGGRDATNVEVDGVSFHLGMIVLFLPVFQASLVKHLIVHVHDATEHKLLTFAFPSVNSVIFPAFVKINTKIFRVN